MNNLIRFILCTLLIAVHYSGIAQINLSHEQVVQRLEQYSEKNPVEKVYLHLDKPYYGAGDTIWFKAYTVVGSLHRLSLLSQVLHVDLIDKHNLIAKQITLNLIQGTAFGDFALPDTLEEGSYRLRAYTNWMRNAGSDYFYDQAFSIVNSGTNKVFVKATYYHVPQNEQQKVTTDLRFYNIEGKPYAKRPVKYTVQLQSQNAINGQDITDEEGNLTIKLVSQNSNDKQVSGNVTAAIKLDNQTTVYKTIPVKPLPASPDVQFFPESGYLVNGLTSKVAFKAVGTDGLGTDIKGFITNDQNQQVATLNSTHLGMGVFSLTPQAGKNYQAHITFTDGTQAAYSLPKVQDKGYVLAIDNSDPVNLYVKINGNGLSKQKGALSLIAQAGGEMYLHGSGAPGKSNLKVTIAKSRLPAGLVQFTLFSAEGEPLNERLVFIQKPDELTFSQSVLKPVYAAREPMEVALTAKNKKGNPVNGSFSVTVIDETQVPVAEETENTILSNLLLTADLPGYVEKPNYYFTQVTEKTQVDLDVLMLTQGYHRFAWKDVLSGKEQVAAYQPENAITIAGRVTTISGGKPVENAKIELVSQSAGLLALDTITDKNGKFTFVVAFPDSTRFMLKAEDKRGKSSDLQIVLDNNYLVVGKEKVIADIGASSDDKLQIYLQSERKKYEQELKYGIGEHSINLKAVNIKAKTQSSERQMQIEKAVEFSANLNGKGVADQILTAEDWEYRDKSTFSSLLEGKITGVTFDTRSKVPYLNSTQHELQAITITRDPFKLKNPDQSKTYKLPMMIVLNGMTLDITESDYLENINLNDVSSVEVLSSPSNTAIYGSRAAGGVLIITTKHGQIFNEPKRKSLSIISPQGYYKAREFYSPRYDHPKTTTSLPDLRTTIYWNPMLKPDQSGRLFFQYFNADSKGVYRIVMEGIDDAGNLIRRVSRYKVE